MATNTDVVGAAPRSNLSVSRRYLSWEGLLDLMAALGTIWIFLLMFVVCADVIGRAAFSAPIHGVGTFAGYSIIGIAFLQLPEALYSRRMMRSDFFLNCLSDWSPRFRNSLEAVFSLVSAAVFGLCAKVSLQPFWSAWESAEKAGVEGLFTFPTWPFRFLIVAGTVLCALEALRQFIIYLAMVVDRTEKLDD